MVTVEWGEQGLQSALATADAVIIVDVLSFSTCVTVAAEQGAIIFASRENAPASPVAGRRGEGQFSLSPATLRRLGRGDQLVLPSPNGARLTTLTAGKPTFAGCLRNAQAVARAAEPFGRVLVVAAGERWPGDHSLRPAFEDELGAGAIVAALAGFKSPEARAAEAVFRAFAGGLRDVLLACASGQELVGRGYPQDVLIAAELDASTVAPRLSPRGCYV